jgi:hypothetical protein
LRLHTIKALSALPYTPVAASEPRYVPTAHYARYLADYAESHGLDVRLGQAVRRVARGNGDWIVTSDGGAWRATVVVIAMGRHNVPRMPTWPGARDFGGQLLHSHDYRSGRAYAGKSALVIGIGTGDLSRYGLSQERWGPFTARRPPVIDVGFLAQLKAGRIAIRPDVARFTPRGVVFTDASALDADVVVAATGYTTGLPDLLDVGNALDDRAFPGAGAAPPPGLFFAGYAESPRGQLFESARAAPVLAREIDRYLRGLARLRLTDAQLLGREPSRE